MKRILFLFSATVVALTMMSCDKDADAGIDADVSVRALFQPQAPSNPIQTRDELTLTLYGMNTAGYYGYRLRWREAGTTEWYEYHPVYTKTTPLLV